MGLTRTGLRKSPVRVFGAQCAAASFVCPCHHHGYEDSTTRAAAGRPFDLGPAFGNDLFCCGPLRPFGENGAG
ncbi:unnamed protein product [Symbiodinium sp. KB8]|nr:unnamed protein product [Symbiodinium sp. KB8]